MIYAIPQLLLVLLFVNWWGPGLLNIFLAIGLVGWVTEARLVRGQFLSLREQEYVERGRVAGAGSSYIIRKHMLPNSLTPIIVALTFGIPTAIFTEAALSFVGVGIRPPQASWGQMVAEGSKPGYIETDPHMLLFPVLAIGLTMLGFTFLGRRPARCARSESTNGLTTWRIRRTRPRGDSSSRPEMNRSLDRPMSVHAEAKGGKSATGDAPMDQVGNEAA